VRIHSGGLPPRHAALLADALAGLDHVPESTAEAAAGDDGCVAFVGPWRSQTAASWAPALNAAGIVQVVPAGTWVGLTRDEPGADPGVEKLRPSGRPTLVRGVPRDTVACAAIVANAPERLAVVHEHEDYGVQLAGQLRMVGLREAPDPEAVVYCGIAGNAPDALLTGRRVYAFDGAQGFGDAHTRFVLPYRPREGYTDDEVLAFLPPVRDAADLVRGALEAGDRGGVRDAVWELGRFDEHGDPPERRCGVWRSSGGGFTCVDVWEAP
jgi:hypothetical protein